jgi:hypothetical protein
MPFDLTREWFELRIQYGRCEQTGIAFEFDSLPNSNRSPWAFSVDRIDAAYGYTVKNSQAVVWAYNAAKGSGSDSDVLFLAKCVLSMIPQDQRREIQRMPASCKDVTFFGVTK